MMRLFLCLLTLFFANAGLSVAQNPAPPVEGGPVTIPLDEEIAEEDTAIGLVVLPDKAIQKSSAVIRKEKNGKSSVRFSITNDEALAAPFVTAIIFRKNGEALFAPVLAANDAKGAKTIAALPDCPSPKINIQAMQSQTAALRSLVDVRKARKNYYLAKIQKDLPEPLMMKLQKMETLFGLPSSPPLSAELPPYELGLRLDKLRAAIMVYREKDKPAK